MSDYQIHKQGGDIYIDTKHGAIRLTSDPTMPRDEIRFETPWVGVDMASGPDVTVVITRCALCSTELSDDAATEQHHKVCGPDALKVGDYVRWWPDLHDDDKSVAFTTDRSADGVIVETDGRYVRQMYVTAVNNWRQTRALIGWPKVGTLYDTTVLPGVIRATMGNAETHKVDTAVDPGSMAACPPASVAPQLIDDLTRERCLELYEMKQREERDPDDPWGCARIELSPNQIAVAREMWSSALRVKVAARKEAERCAVGYCESDPED